MKNFGNTCILFLFSLIVLTSVELSSQEDVGQYLETLGRSIARRLTKPGPGSDTLLRDLYDYNNHLEEIHQNITSRDAALAKEGYDLVQEITEDGGPPHLKVEVDFDEFLFKIFKNDRDVQVIHTALKDNRKSWEKVKLLYEKHAQI